ncbi:hypothetical protein [Bacillus sp. T33-2]|uniref:hypothetical protein n=1 Tax=Bacillus sp. T33-2 TaxID=2054168 RepID=UPI000C760240|nr:hypothetical protein [Bacillus sp. T33-2]PLR99608.1 hypothetical protein CVD19_00665 [Bacillus sp. T33-2]
MYIRTETNGNITDVKTRILNISYNIGLIDEVSPGYYRAYSYDSTRLKANQVQDKPYLFITFEDAKKAIVEAFEAIQI